MAADPRTSADLLADALIRRQIGLMRYAGGVTRRTHEILDATESTLRYAIRRRMRLAKGLQRPSDVSRLRALLGDVKRIRGRAWDRIEDLWTAEVRTLATAEAKALDVIIRTVVPVQLVTTMPTTPTLSSLATKSPFEGRPLSGWARKVKLADVARIEGAIRLGLSRGDGVPDIARRVVGTVALRGRNGVTQIARRDAETIVRTATSAIASAARTAFMQANSDVVQMEQWHATLDAATTPFCRATDGKRFPVGQGPQPPAHFRCRSIRVPILDDEMIGMRPSKPVTERGLLREFAAREGFDAPTSRDGLPHGTKATFDAFARKRTREMIGRVPAKTTYQEWLSRQSAAFQDDVLGATRGALFRRGDLKLDRFVDSAGRERTLAELARLEAKAFRDAGLDPDAFLR